MNNKQSSLTSRIIYNLFFICLLIPSTIFPLGGMPGGFDLNNFSEEDMANMEQELMQVQKEIDDYVGSLSPQEQQEFFDTVQQVEEMMGNMSEDELAGFLQEVTDEMMQEVEQLETEKEPSTPTAKPEEKPVVKKDDKSEEILKRELSVKSLLDSLIERTGSFIVKTQNIPNLDQLIDRWSGQQKIVNIPQGESPGNVAVQIELFQQKLHTLKTTMPKDKETYVFFEKLVEDEELFAELTNLEEFLNAQEPKFVVSALGIEKLSPDSKKILQQILSAYSRIIYPLDVITKINEILQTYDLIAKEVRQEMEQARKRAEEFQKQQRRVPGAAPSYGRGFGDDYGRHGYGNDYYGSPYGDSNAYSNYGHTPSSRARDDRRKPSRKPSKLRDAKDKKGKERKIKDKKEKDEKKADEEKKKTKVTPSTFCLIGESIEENIKVFERHMNDIEVFAKNSVWKNFKTKIQAENFGTTENPVNNKIKFVLLPSAKTHLEAATKLIKRMHKTPMSKEQISTVNRIYTNKKAFSRLMNELDTINIEFATLKLNDKAKEAYFTGKDKATELPGLNKKLAQALRGLKEEEEKKEEETKEQEKKDSDK